MITWKNLDTVEAYQELAKVEPVNLKEAMSGESGAERVCCQHSLKRKPL